MTSIPASRSARAMIFAPRSCPSRPGFATTTLIFPVVMRGSICPFCAPPLEPRGLTPDPPELPEGVPHLPHRHVGAGGVDDRAHEVPVVVGGVVLESRERRLD